MHSSPALKGMGIPAKIIETVPGKYITVALTPDELEIRAESSPFFFRAEIRGGILSINTLLKENLGNRDIDLPSGKDLVRIAMNFLESHQTINEFRAIWKDGTDTFRQFMTNRNPSGTNNEDAAWQTWSGQNIALPYGFTKIQAVYPVLYGNDRFIQVNFARPRPTPAP